LFSIHSLNKVLYHIKNHLDDNFILVGGYSRLLQGYEKDYGKSDIDIVILPEYKDKLLELGLIGTIEEQFFSYPILEQFVICYNDTYFLDVFVSDRNINWVRVNGIKCSTLQDDVNHFSDLYKTNKHTYIKEKYENSKRRSESI